METLKSEALPGGRPATYWLVVERVLDLPEALTVGDLPDEEALAVFSFEEEALLFLSVQELTDGWTAKEVAVAELVSLLLDLRPTRIALDPLPGHLGRQMVDLLSVSTARFLRDLARKRWPIAIRLLVLSEDAQSRRSVAPAETRCSRLAPDQDGKEVARNPRQ